MDDLRRRIAQAIADDLAEQDGETAHRLGEDLSWSWIDQGATDFGRIADRILSIIESPVTKDAPKSGQ